MNTLIISLIIAAAVLIFLAIIFATGYVKAPPDTAYIISGIKKKPRIVIGKATVKIPLLERKDALSLELVSVGVQTSNPVPTADYINIHVDASVNVKISGDQVKLERAAQNFLNKDTDYIRRVAQEVLEGNIREIIGKMQLKEMVGDRQKFADLVKENADPDLSAMGLDIVSFNVQNFSDENGVINDLGIDNISQIKKTASIAKANADKEVAIAQAKAEQEANEARVNAAQEIAKKNNALALQEADLKKSEDTARAVADAAYDIQQQEQRKSIEVTTANADIARQEREVELKQREAEVMEKALDAEVRKKAEAERYARQQKADAELYERQKDAEAQKYERQREAEAKKAEAEAEKYAKEQNAAGIKAIGVAEAEAIRQKGLAEAEAMEKKAEAYQKYNNAAMAEMLIKVLPDIAARIAEPLQQIDKITIIGGNADGVASVADNVPTVMAKMMESMKEATGIDLGEIVRAGTYDAKVNRNLNVNMDGSIQTDVCDDNA